MTITILQGDVVEQLKTLPDCSVQCVVTSPPYYGLRNYGTGNWAGGRPHCFHKVDPIIYTAKHGDICPLCGAVYSDNQIGMEETPELFVAKIVEVFCEVKRVLRDDGVLWLNLGDSYSGSNSTKDAAINPNSLSYNSGQTKGGVSKCIGVVPGCKAKDLIGIPWMVAFALRADGWYLRSDIIWSKPNPMPESVTDRPTKAHEYVFLLTKKAKYYYDADAVREPLQECSIERAKYGWNGTMIFNDKGKEEYRSQPDPVDKMGERWSPTQGRNRRTVWEIATQPTPEAHFATFPEALVKPCIKAGTSERGCCAACGAPLERVVEYTGQTSTEAMWGKDKAIYQSEQGKLQNIRGLDKPRDVKTTGWQPSCSCNADTVPCIVLDPFGGSGTTAKVARDLKRDCILIELNPAYVKIMKNKLRLNEQLVI